MANINDVAKRAGVSIATVSNVFNESDKVKDNTKAKVLKAATELNYSGMGDFNTKNSLNSKTIGVIVEDISVFNSPEIMDAIGRTSKEKGWEVLICNLGIIRSTGGFDFDKFECAVLAQKTVNLLVSKKVDGIIYLGCQSREIRNILTCYVTPFVYAYCYSKERNIPAILYDDKNAAYELTRYLIKNGHKNIGIIAGPDDNIHVRERLLGFQSALFEAEILYNPNRCMKVDWNNSQCGYDCMDLLMAEKITAVFCMNDVLAGGVYDYAFAKNISIPKNLSVVGFDNRQIASVLNPRLTTVALPLKDIGVEAVLQLENILSSKNNMITDGPIVFGCKLMIRDSVADLNK